MHALQVSRASMRMPQEAKDQAHPVMTFGYDDWATCQAADVLVAILTGRGYVDRIHRSLGSRYIYSYAETGFVDTSHVEIDIRAVVHAAPAMKIEEAAMALTDLVYSKLNPEEKFTMAERLMLLWGQRADDLAKQRKR